MTISDSTACHMLVVAERCGVDTAKICRELELDEALFARGMPALDLSVFAMLAERLTAATGREDFGLMLAESIPIGTYNPLEFAAWSAPTAGAAIELIARFTQFDPYTPDLETTDDPSGHALRIVGPPDLPREIVEFTFAFLYVRGLQAGCGRWISVELAHRAPRDPTIQERFFGCPVTFGAPSNTALLTASAWNHPMTSSDPVTYDRLRSALDDIAKRTPLRFKSIALQRAGDWVRVGATTIPLHRRGPLRRIMLALANLRVKSSGRVLTRDQLFEIGWPGERALVEAAAQRVHTAIWELRKLGLREALLGTDEGYHLDPMVEIRLEP